MRQVECAVSVTLGLPTAEACWFRLISASVNFRLLSSLMSSLSSPRAALVKFDTDVDVLAGHIGPYKFYLRLLTKTSAVLADMLTAGRNRKAYDIHRSETVTAKKMFIPRS